MEFVGLNHSQKIFGEKNLLQCKMEILSTIKRYQLYKKLRKEENALKNLLRKKIKELEENIKIFDDSLPEVRNEMLAPSHRLRTHDSRKHKLLDDQIEDIKKRLAALH